MDPSIHMVKKRSIVSQSEIADGNSNAYDIIENGGHSIVPDGNRLSRGTELDTVSV